MPFKYSDMCERLIANSVVLPVDDPDYHEHDGEPCWLWTGRRDREGYGKLNVRLKRGPRKGQIVTHRAHRLAIIHFKGRRMTPKMVGKHLCNNPPCINPMHLRGGTQISNIRQCVREGRHRNGYTK